MLSFHTTYGLPVHSGLVFSSVAEQHKEQVIGIVLSGSGTDGTIGLKAIKHEGGLTFAQDDSAKFNGMPKSAIAAGVVDFVLSPKEIARKLVNFGKFGYVKHRIFGKGKEDEIEDENVDLKRIIRLLHEGVGVDFTHYKMNTIKRRILRRMVLNKKKTLKAYATTLSKNSVELYQYLVNISPIVLLNNKILKPHRFIIK